MSYSNCHYFKSSTDADRPMAVIVKVLEIEPIPNANAIELATVLGWQCVVKKQEFKVDDLGVYFCIDSILDPENPNFASCEGRRLKTKSMLGVYSQGLLLPLSTCFPNTNADDMKVLLSEGEDVTQVLKVRKYVAKTEIEVYAKVSGTSRATFPSFIPQTDEERVQNIPKRLKQLLPGKEIVITRKEDGTSTTFVHKDDQFFICSRNHILLQEGKDNHHYFAMEKKYNVGEGMKRLGRNIAIQGETVGPKINGNKMRLNELRFEVFNIWDIDESCYLAWEQCEEICKQLNLLMVPVLYRGPFPAELGSVAALLDMANKLEYSDGVLAEGMVVKSNYGKEFPRCSFKVISNAFLLKHSL